MKTIRADAPVSEKRASCRARSVRAMLAGLVLLSACAASAQSVTDEPTTAVRTFVIEGELPIPQERAQQVLAPYTGDAVGLTQLRLATKALETELSARGYSFYRVLLPPQALESTVTIRVVPFRLGTIAVSGNEYFSTANVLASLPALKQGTSPNVVQVARQRAAANEHPSKQVEVNFSQGEAPDTVDAQVKVQDEPPLRFFVGLNNIGDRQTGKYRASVGLQHSNLWNRDHSVTASYTTSPDHVSDVTQVGVFYRAPFYSVGGALTLFYTYSDVSSGTIANAFEVSGRGKFAGARWRQHLAPIGAYAHALEIGIDDRLFENDVSFAGTPIGVDVRSRPLTLAYQGRIERAASNLGGRVEYVHNLSGGSNNTGAAYTANRAGASPHFKALRYSLDGQTRVEPIIFSARLRGQQSGEPLIPGEQFGLGGALSVRGLREREVLGDSGSTLTVEGLLPLPWPGLFGVLFADAGEVRLKDALPGQPSRQEAASIGIGLRWISARKFSLSLDAAYVVDGTTVSDSGDSRLHLSFVYFF